MKMFSALIGVAMLLVATSAFAQNPNVHVFCNGVDRGKITLGGRLNTAAASAARTLLVHGDCRENVTVRNLRVIIDLGTFGGSISAPTDFPGTPAITFTGGTTDATLTGGTVTGTIVIDRNAAVTVQNVHVRPPSGNRRAIDIRRGGLGTLNTNVVTGFSTGTGIDVREQALSALGTGSSRNTVGSFNIGIKCRNSVVTGLGGGGTNGLSSITGNTTDNDGVPITSNSSMTPGGPTSCFNDL